MSAVPSPGETSVGVDPVPVPMLMYHSVADESSPRFRPYAVAPSDFAAHMEALDGAGYTPVTVRSFVELADRPAADWPERPVVLTFDDAFQDFHTRALPVLAAHGFAATLYVPTEYVGQTSRWLAREGEGNRAMMTWQGLAEAGACGVEIGSHSRSHPQLDLAPPRQAVAEIRESKQMLEDQLQAPVTTFAYPFGYWNRSVRSMVVEAGYESACAVRDLVASSTAERYSLSRWTVPFGMDAAALLRVLQERTGRLDELRSDSRAQASRLLRRLGLKRRGEAGDEVPFAGPRGADDHG